MKGTKFTLEAEGILAAHAHNQQILRDSDSDVLR
jgi:hypothetical protein